MKVVIISTYPEHGSKNIGDHLITTSLVSAIKNVKGDEVEFSVIWREANWQDVAGKITDANLILFACLAIRPNMSVIEYPFLRRVLDSGVPYGVVSAGTDLDVSSNGSDLFEGFSSETLSLLRRMNDGAIFFTTRGFLTQSCCMALGLKRAVFSGDVAFYDKRYFGLRFERLCRVNKIAISDPHKASSFLPSFEVLLNGIKRLFPLASIDVLLHGVNPKIERFALQCGVGVKCIFLDKDAGLDLYDDYDLHVGYRVHAHVSALSRRKPSYLLEQDGRGCDYGLTLERKISVPSYGYVDSGFSLKELGRLLVGRKPKKRLLVPVAPALELISMIENDAIFEFDKFLGLESQILKITDAIEKHLMSIE